MNDRAHPTRNGETPTPSPSAPRGSVNTLERVTDPERTADDAPTARLRQALHEAIERASRPLSGERADDTHERQVIDRETVAVMHPRQVRDSHEALVRDPQAGATVLGRVRAALDAEQAPAARSGGPVPLQARFKIIEHTHRRDYEFRADPGKVAFTERWLSLQSRFESTLVVKAMVERAQERGWTTLRVRGTPEFQRQAWIAAQARGIQALGYEPTPADHQAAKEEQQRLATVRRDPAVARGAEPEPSGGSITREAPPENPTDRHVAAGPSLPNPAVMVALEKALGEQRVPEAVRARVRDAVAQELTRRQQRGVTPKVRVYDAAAPRSQPRDVSVPAPARKDRERAR